MHEQSDGWIMCLELDASLLFTADEPDWLRPDYITQIKEDTPWLTPEQETDLINEQIEASQGFDIDFSKFRCLFNYHPVDFDDYEFVDQPETNLDLLKRLSQTSIDNYNQEFETRYEFVKVLYANFHMSAGVMFLITFQVKDPSSDNLTKDFQARVHHSFLDESNFVFCRPKPDQEDSYGVGVAERDVKKPILE